MSVQRIRKNDIVVVRKGSSAGKTGKVLFVIKGRNRAIVEGVNLVKKCQKKSQENPQGGIVEKEASLNAANLMLQCPECKKGVPVARVKDGPKNVRKCKRCGHLFDS